MAAGTTAARLRLVVLVAAATALSWLGFAVHNIADLPRQAWLGPETIVPSLVTLAIFVAWWRLPRSRIPAWLLFGWALTNLVGGAIVSVLPLPFLPFSPDQSLKHFAFHVLYGLTQLPLIVVLVGQWRSPAP